MKRGGVKNKANFKLISIITLVVVALLGIGSYWYITYQIPHNEAVSLFNKAAQNMQERNDALDNAISDLQTVMGSGEKPLDDTTLSAASAAIGAAQGSKETIPDMPQATDEIKAAADQIDHMAIYTDQLDSLSTAQANLLNSIEQLKLVTYPTEQYVIERLTGLPNITAIEAATEQNDPNRSLHKQGGYTAAVFFSSDLVDQSNVYAWPEYTGIPAAGTDSGGCIEVFANVEDANSRNTYLSSFNGIGVLNPGSHNVVGTCVIRTSQYLTASQQQELEQLIVQSLTKIS